jgi:hypothetical protein
LICTVPAVVAPAVALSLSLLSPLFRPLVRIRFSSQSGLKPLLQLRARAADQLADNARQAL